MIKILIDSASDIDIVEAKSLGIELISMQVRMGEEEYLDGVNLSHRQFFEKLIEGEYPQTSQINEFRFKEKYEECLKECDELLVITLSSKLSGTFASAEKAAKDFGEKVAVVDSLNASIGERVLCQYAIRQISQGKSLQEVKTALEEKRNKIEVLALLNTLKYLKKGGRISAVTAFTGEVFSIKPVIAVKGGEVKLVGKAVGSKKGNNLLVQLIEKCGGIDFDMPFVVGYTGLSDEVLKKYLEDSKAIWENKTDNVPSVMIGSTIGTHIGPDAIGVAFFAK